MSRSKITTTLNRMFILYLNVLWWSY